MCEDEDGILSVDKGKGKAGEKTKIDVMAAVMGTPNRVVNVIGKLDVEGVVPKKATTQGKVDFDVFSLPVLTALDGCNSMLKDVDLLNHIRLVLKGDQDTLLHFIVLSCRTMLTRFLPFGKAAHKKVGNVVPHTPPEE
ncbi:hypothetical protein AMTRI_Chr11g96350 [Amborella trichopoda]